jgi:general secretion pathway protein J
MVRYEVLKSAKGREITSQQGFTLIEMLVVLVILALTTSLMTQGLSTTWRNFERLGARDLMNSSAQLPLSWFEESLAGAVLYHPDKPLAIGNSHYFEFITFNIPSDLKHISQKITWRFVAMGNEWQLGFTIDKQKNYVPVSVFDYQPKFEYLTEQNWVTEFSPKSGKLPLAVRIIYGNEVWSVGKIGRPELADLPAGMANMGKYEY